MRLVTIATAALLAAPAANAAVFADSATTEDVTFFGSGTLTGGPDRGGAFLSDSFDPPDALGSITFGFSGGLVDGPGADIEFYEVTSSASETFDVSLSADGSSFTSLGEFSATNNVVDIAGAFAGRFDFVRVTNTSTSVSADLDAAEGFHEAAAIPVPAALPLTLTALAGLAVIGRRRRH